VQADPSCPLALSDVGDQPWLAKAREWLGVPCFMVMGTDWALSRNYTSVTLGFVRRHFDPRSESAYWLNKG
jgi:hypothetical protein